MPPADAVQGFAARLTAVRCDQTAQRANAPLVGPDCEHDHLVQINPFANWSKAQVWDYIDRHQVPINPLDVPGYHWMELPLVGI